MYQFFYPKKLKIEGEELYQSMPLARGMQNIYPSRSTYINPLIYALEV